VHGTRAGIDLGGLGRRAGGDVARDVGVRRAGARSRRRAAPRDRARNQGRPRAEGVAVVATHESHHYPLWEGLDRVGFLGTGPR
jgi:hypothetical protein